MSRSTGYLNHGETAKLTATVSLPLKLARDRRESRFAQNLGEGRGRRARLSLLFADAARDPCARARRQHS